MDNDKTAERMRTIAALDGHHQAAAELTVRDFYAAHVLASIAQHYPVGDAESAARHAFAFANAAIQERAR